MKTVTGGDSRGRGLRPSPSLIRDLRVYIQEASSKEITCSLRLVRDQHQTMKVSMFTVVFSALVLALLSAPLTTADNEIGYCQNLGTGDLEVTVDWRGIANGVLSLIPIPGSGVASAILGGILSFLPNIGVEQTDYTEYMQKLGQCVDAMINEAIIQDNLVGDLSSHIDI